MSNNLFYYFDDLEHRFAESFEAWELGVQQAQEIIPSIVIQIDGWTLETFSNRFVKTFVNAFGFMLLACWFLAFIPMKILEYGPRIAVIFIPQILGLLFMVMGPLFLSYLISWWFLLLYLGGFLWAGYNLAGE